MLPARRTHLEIIETQLPQPLPGQQLGAGDGVGAAACDLGPLQCDIGVGHVNIDVPAGADIEQRHVAGATRSELELQRGVDRQPFYPGGADVASHEFGLTDGHLVAVGGGALAQAIHEVLPLGGEAQFGEP